MSAVWLVVGAAGGVWRDLEKFDRLGSHPAGVIAVNRMMADFPRDLTCGATLHPDMAAGWVGGRGLRVFAHSAGPGVTDIVPWSEGWQGTSALYAVEIALKLGAEKIVLAGVPMDEGPHYYDTDLGISALGEWLDLYRSGWRCARPTIQGIVKSMSGWTRTVLGAPTKEWAS